MHFPHIPTFGPQFPHPMANTGDISIGTYIRFNNDICQIVEWQHRTPGNLRAFYQGKMRNLRNGKLNEHRFRSGENMDVLRVEIRDMQSVFGIDGSSAGQTTAEVRREIMRSKARQITSQFCAFQTLKLRSFTLSTPRD